MKNMKAIAASVVALMFLVAASPVMADDSSALEEDFDMKALLEKIPHMEKGFSVGTFSDLDEDKVYNALRLAALELGDLLKMIGSQGSGGGESEEVPNATLTTTDLMAILESNTSIDGALKAAIEKIGLDMEVAINECTASDATQFEVLEASEHGYKVSVKSGAIIDLDIRMTGVEDVKIAEGSEDGVPMAGISMKVTSSFTMLADLTPELIPHAFSTVSNVVMNYSLTNNFSSWTNEQNERIFQLFEPKSQSESVETAAKTQFAMAEDSVKNLTIENIMAALSGADVGGEIGYTMVSEVAGDQFGEAMTMITQGSVDMKDLFPEEATEKFNELKGGIPEIIGSMKGLFDGEPPTTEEILEIMGSFGMETDPSMGPMITAVVPYVIDALKTLKDNLWDNDSTMGFYSVKGGAVVHENVKSNVESILSKCESYFGNEAAFDVLTPEFLGALGVSSMGLGPRVSVDPAEGSTSIIIPSAVYGKTVGDDIEIDDSSSTVKTLTLPASVRTLTDDVIEEFADDLPSLATIVAPGLTSIQTGCLDDSGITLIVSETKVSYTPGSGDDAEEGANPVSIAWMIYDDTAIAGFQDLVFADGKISGTAVPQNGKSVPALSVIGEGKSVDATISGAEFSFPASANAEYKLSTASDELIGGGSDDTGDGSDDAKDDTKVKEVPIKKAEVLLADVDAILQQEGVVDSGEDVGLVIVVDARGSPKDGFATVAGDAVKKVSDSKVGMTIETDNGSFVMSPEVGAKLAEKPGNVSVSIKDDGIALTEAQESAVEGKTVYDFELLVGDEKPTEYGGLLEFEVKFILGEGESPNKVVAQYVDENGKTESVKVEYDAATSMATIYTPHCSVYALSSSADDGMGSMVLPIALLVIVALVLVFVFRDRLFHKV